MNALTIPQTDLRLVYANLGHARVAELRAWCEIVTVFDRASDKEACAAELARRFAGVVSGGLSVKSLYRKVAAAKVNGWRGLVDGRTLAKALGSRSDVRSRPEFVAFWQNLCAENQRATAPAYRKLFVLLRMGQFIPGYGTWQDIYRAEFPRNGLPPACPYEAKVFMPVGWSESTLGKIKPNAFGLAATRTGMLAAANLIPMIPKTRAGLKRGQIIQIDDMYPNVKVAYGENGRTAERVVELSIVDVATGYLACWLMKPVLKREDGTKEHLQSCMMPYVIAHHLRTNGYCPDGSLIQGEHAAARANDYLRKAVADVTDGKVSFGEGGILSKPLAAGLYDARPRGNFRYKGLLECLHSLKQNETADIKGQVGSARDTAPEDIYGRDKAMLALTTAAIALEPERPGILDRLILPWIPFSDFSALTAEAYDRINRREDHALEGWSEQGFITGEWRVSESDGWKPLADLDPAGDLYAIVAGNPTYYRQRRMSPAEAWELREGDVVRIEDWAVPVILGPGLACAAVVDDKCQLLFVEESTRRKHLVAALVSDEFGNQTLLERGTQVLVWVNPLDPTIAYINGAGKNEGFLGTAPVMVPGHGDDLETLQRNLGIRSAVIAKEVEKIRPIALHRLKEADAAAAHNVREIAGYDPVEQPPPKAEKPPKAADAPECGIVDLMPPEPQTAAAPKKSLPEFC